MCWGRNTGVGHSTPHLWFRRPQTYQMFCFIIFVLFPRGALESAWSAFAEIVKLGNGLASCQEKKSDAKYFQRSLFLGFVRDSAVSTKQWNKVKAGTVAALDSSRNVQRTKRHLGLNMLCWGRPKVREAWGKTWDKQDEHEQCLKFSWRKEKPQDQQQDESSNWQDQWQQPEVGEQGPWRADRHFWQLGKGWLALKSVGKVAPGWQVLWLRSVPSECEIVRVSVSLGLLLNALSMSQRVSTSHLDSFGASCHCCHAMPQIKASDGWRLCRQDLRAECRAEKSRWKVLWPFVSCWKTIDINWSNRLKHIDETCWMTLNDQMKWKGVKWWCHCQRPIHPIRLILYKLVFAAHLRLRLGLEFPLPTFPHQKLRSNRSKTEICGRQQLTWGTLGGLLTCPNLTFFCSFSFRLQYLYCNLCSILWSYVSYFRRLRLLVYMPSSMSLLLCFPPVVLSAVSLWRRFIESRSRDPNRINMINVMFIYVSVI